MAYYRAANYRSKDGLISVFEKYDHVTALRIARGLGVLREYVRGDKQVVQDIASSWRLYVRLFPEETT